MRTPNCTCCICQKPLYRRPSDLKRVRHVACIEHRAVAQCKSGITDRQKAALSLGRRKGTNNRNGYRHRAETKLAISRTNLNYWSHNQQKAIERGAKCRAENHYNWKGGLSKLAQSIRQMTEYRKWADAVKQRDEKCVGCGSLSGLESHHLTGFARILQEYGINSRDAARKCQQLWDLSNGVTLCQKCHFKEHGRRYAD